MKLILLFMAIFWIRPLWAVEVPTGESVSSKMETSQGVIQLIEQDRNEWPGPGTSGGRAFHLIVDGADLGIVFVSPYNVSVEDINNRVIFFSALWGGSQSGVLTSQVLEGGELKDAKTIDINMLGDSAEDELSSNILSNLMDKGMKFTWKSKSGPN